MTDTRTQHLLPWVYSVLLHAAFLAMLILSIHWTNSTLPSLGGHSQIAQPVQATVVDQKLINQQMALLQAQEKKKQEAQQQLLQQAAAAKTERQQEEQKVAQLKQQQAAAQQALDTKMADLQKQAQAEQQHLAQLKAEAAAQAKKKQSAENARRQAELKREIAAEQHALDAKKASYRQQWAALITQKIENNWSKPPTAPNNLKCTVDVQQVPGGTVTNATVRDCNGDDAVRQSIVNAVYQSSPLPPPPDPSIFDRNLTITFCPGCSPGN
ncbi:MAG: cell envelope integrity protein TolA [Gammaproteobacteria bacterium]